MSELRFAADALTAAERRDLANPLRAAWNAALGETRILVLDQVVKVDEAVAGGRA
jgi:hypothetical protein